MSGNEVSDRSKIDDRLEKIENIIKEYVDNLGIPFNNPNTNIGKLYLSMTKDEMKGLTKDECMIRSLVLAQLAMSVQLQINRENARYNWADSQLSVMASTDNYVGTRWTSFDEKKLRLIKEDEAAKKLNNIKTYAKVRSDHLNFIANSIKNISDILKEMSKIRGNINA
jgi:hypothetical protein